jgi:type III secretion protein U
MAGDDVEEKKFAPTQSRIKQLRRDGSIAHSTDLPGAVALLLLVIYLLVSYRWLSVQFQNVIAIDIFNAGTSFAERAGIVLKSSLYLLGYIAAPFMVLAFLILLLATVLDLQGFVVSGKSVAPDFNRINPVEGIKKMFKLRALFDLIKGLVKALILTGAMVGVVILTLNSLLWSPTCDAQCVYPAALITIGMALALGAVIIFIFALIDVPVSRFLFTHENKMTLSEYKRNRKEDQGDPMIKSMRKQRAKDMLEGGASKQGQSNIVIVAEGAAVGLRFVRGETPAPVVIAKLLNEDAMAFVISAKAKGVPVIENEELARSLITRAPSGEVIPQAFYDPVAQVLVSAGMLK